MGEQGKDHDIKQFCIIRISSSRLKLLMCPKAPAACHHFENPVCVYMRPFALGQLCFRVCGFLLFDIISHKVQSVWVNEQTADDSRVEIITHTQRSFGSIFTAAEILKDSESHDWCIWGSILSSFVFLTYLVFCRFNLASCLSDDIHESFVDTQFCILIALCCFELQNYNKLSRCQSSPITHKPFKIKAWFV